MFEESFKFYVEIELDNCNLCKDEEIGSVYLVFSVFELVIIVVELILILWMILEVRIFEWEGLVLNNWKLYNGKLNFVLCGDEEKNFIVFWGFLENFGLLNGSWVVLGVIEMRRCLEKLLLKLLF